jgi:hypothetical protein
MIQDVELVRQLDAGRAKFAEGSNNAAGVEITLGIIIFAHDQNARIMAAYSRHQVVQCLKVPVIVRKAHAVLSDGVQQVHSIPFARHTDLGWQAHIMASLPE